MKPEKVEWVYLIRQCGSSYVKIGKTTRTPESRLLDLQTSNPNQLEIVVKIKTTNCSAVEQYLHKKYSKCRHRLEWFVLSAEQIESIQREFESGKLYEWY